MIALDQTTAELMAREGYDRMAEVYTAHVASELTAPSFVRSTLEAFAHMAQQTAGPVADVGCGPGHITNFLRGLGLDIFGVDNSPVLLDVAHRVYPDLRFEIGQLASLPIATASLRGVISRHSLIHTPVDLVPAALDEIARVLAPDGVLFLSFFGCADPDAHGERFDHAVATAYQLDVDRTAELLDVAGFSEEVRVVQQPRAGERQLPHGTLIARRRS